MALPVLDVIRRCAAPCPELMSNSILASLCQTLALVLAGAVFAGIAAENESTDSLTAQQILDKMASTYATCKSYRDSGVATNDFGPHNATDQRPRNIDVQSFRTAFIRPDQFRFEYGAATPDKPNIIWVTGGEVRTWYMKPGVEKQPSLDMGIAGASGVSYGLADTIPSLLMPGQISGAKLSAMIDLIRLPDETLDGTACFKLQGKYGFGGLPTTLWLEKATFLIRCVAQQAELWKGLKVYRSEVNKDIPAKELEFNPPKAR